MRILNAMVVSAAMLAAASASAADDAGWYIGGAAGLNMPHNAKITDPFRQTSVLKLKDGFAVQATGGYKFGTGLRTELELSYGEGKLKDLGSNAQPLVGKQRDTSLMANALWDFNTGTSLTPYVGVGLGNSWMRFSHVSTVGGTTFFDGSSSELAWQAIAGVSLNISPKLDVTLDYRYKGSGHHDFPAVGSPTTRLTGYDARTSRIMLGLRYSFGAPEKVAAAAPPPPPPPAPAPAPRPPAPPAQPAVAETKFLVFFDFDRSNLRADSAKIVSQAADVAKKTGKAHIIATGHTDTSGTAAYNLALSERRAKAVQKELNKLGIPNSEIVVRWKGESEPLVQTGDGVKEPQNRRVEIVLE